MASLVSRRHCTRHFSVVLGFGRLDFLVFFTFRRLLGFLGGALRCDFRVFVCPADPPPLLMAGAVRVMRPFMLRRGTVFRVTLFFRTVNPIRSKPGAVWVFWQLLPWRRTDFRVLPFQRCIFAPPPLAEDVAMDRWFSNFLSIHLLFVSKRMHD